MPRIYPAHVSTASSVKEVPTTLKVNKSSNISSNNKNLPVTKELGKRHKFYKLVFQTRFHIPSDAARKRKGREGFHNRGTVNRFFLKKKK